MTTHPDILTELAVRYGGCDVRSEKAIEEFYSRRFPGLPQEIRDRISFEILHRDGEVAPGQPLTKAEIENLDAHFQNLRAFPAVEGQERFFMKHENFKILELTSFAMYCLVAIMVVFKNSISHMFGGDYRIDAIVAVLGLLAHGAVLYRHR